MVCQSPASSVFLIYRWDRYGTEFHFMESSPFDKEIIKINPIIYILKKIKNFLKKHLQSVLSFAILSKSSRTRPIGQAVKTPPSHGGNRGSIPLLAVF